MAQLIYAISALGIVVLLAVNMQRSSGDSEKTVYTNEVLTQLVTIGRDLVDDIARQNLPFDAAVDPDRLPSSATYPYVHNPSELTSEAEFGGCDNFEDCLDIDDFHGMDPVEGERNGIPYAATFEVQYVDEEDAESTGGTQTYAKEIIVTVTSTSIQVNGEDVSATYRRVLTYPRITNYAY